MLKKIDASLNEKLASVEWGEYKVSELFKIQKVTKMLSKESLSDKYCFPAYSSDSSNNGIVVYLSSEKWTIL